jgi:endonuclease YncB( thermonuclease family)
MPRIALGILVAALVLVCGITLWTAWYELTPPTTAVLAQSADNETQQVSVTRVVDGDTIEVSPQVEGTTDGYASSVWIPPRYPGEKNPATPRPPPSLRSNSKVKM